MESSPLKNPLSDIHQPDNDGVTEEQLRTILARNVEERRKRLGITQEQMEARAGLGQSTVSRILNLGGSATLKSLAALANALECRPYELLLESKEEREAALRKILKD